MTKEDFETNPNNLENLGKDGGRGNTGTQEEREDLLIPDNILMAKEEAREKLRLGELDKEAISQARELGYLTDEDLEQAA